MQAYRWIADSRDEFAKERLQQLDDEFKVTRGDGVSMVLVVLTCTPFSSPLPLSFGMLYAALPLPSDHELHPCVPQGPQPRTSHRQDHEANA